jgi:hypothetical protein
VRYFSSKTRAGIGGILKTQEEKAKETDKSLQEAFQDLSALMEKAREMVSYFFSGSHL